MGGFVSADNFARVEEGQVCTRGAGVGVWAARAAVVPVGAGIVSWRRLLEEGKAQLR